MLRVFYFGGGWGDHDWCHAHIQSHTPDKQLRGITRDIHTYMQRADVVSTCARFKRSVGESSAELRGRSIGRPASMVVFVEMLGKVCNKVCGDLNVQEFGVLIRAPSGSLTGPLGSLRSNNPMGHAADPAQHFRFLALLGFSGLETSRFKCALDAQSWKPLVFTPSSHR